MTRPDRQHRNRTASRLEEMFRSRTASSLPGAGACIQATSRAAARAARSAARAAGSMPASSRVRVGGCVEAAGRGPELLQDVHDVQHYVDLDGAAPVTNSAWIRSSWWRAPSTRTIPAVVFGVAGFGLVESGGDDLGRVLLDGSGQPLVGGDRSGPRAAVAGAAAGRGDHVVRAAHGRICVVDAGQRRHPFG